MLEDLLHVGVSYEASHFRAYNHFKAPFTRLVCGFQIPATGMTGLCDLAFATQPI